MKVSVLAASLLFMVGISTQCLAGESYSGQAICESAKASSHAGRAAAYGIAASGQAVSAAAAAPFAVAGSAGMVCTHVADALMDAASGCLPVTDQSITAGPPPDEALHGKTGKHE